MSNKTVYQGNKQEPDARSSIRLGTGLAVIACLLLVVTALWLVRGPKVDPSGPDSTAIHSDGLAIREPLSASANAKGAAGVLTGPSAVAQVMEPPERVHPSEPTPETQRLVTSLVHLEPAGGVLTEEEARAWKQTLQGLIAQEALGVAAIKEFLAQNTEYNFAPPAKDLLGYGSARTALLDALAQIGGPEAINAMTGVLQTSADPREIAVLAQDLEKLEPGQHRQEVLEAARQTLEMASAQRLEMPDAAPLFEVLQKFGGPAVVTDLERAASQWNYYGTISLAQLPDDAGIPALVQLAQDPKTSSNVRDATLPMLAQISDRSPEARAALLALARMNQWSLFTWQTVASSLAGDQVGLLNSVFEDHQALARTSGLRTVATSDNQNFFAFPATLTPEQATQRTSLMDDLLAGTTDPAVRELLQQSRTVLMSRSGSPLAASIGQ